MEVQENQVPLLPFSSSAFPDPLPSSLTVITLFLTEIFPHSHFLHPPLTSLRLLLLFSPSALFVHYSAATYSLLSFLFPFLFSIYSLSSSNFHVGLLFPLTSVLYTQHCNHLDLSWSFLFSCLLTKFEWCGADCRSGVTPAML